MLAAELLDVSVKGLPISRIVRLSGAPNLVPAAHEVAEVRIRKPQSDAKSSVRW